VLKIAIGLMLLLVPFVCGASLPKVGQAPSPAKVKSCRDHPQVVGRCFKVYGQLSVYNGAPALRIWKIGTRRMLGISEQRFVLNGYQNLPEQIENQINQNVDLIADFVVCPFTRSRVGEMQLVCVESAKNLVVRKRTGA
jgi:hypothetical protein